MKITLEIDPVSASRPIVARRGVFYGKAYSQFKKDVQWLFNALPEPMQGVFQVNTIYFVPLPKSMSKKKKNEKHDTYCEKNGDLDNLDKALWDCVITKNFIEDDRFIVKGEHQKAWTKGNGYIEFEIIKKDPNKKLNLARDVAE